MRDPLTVHGDEPVESGEPDDSAAIRRSRFQPDERQAEPEQTVLVSMSDYWPGQPLRVVGQLPAPITVRLLRLPTDETIPVIPRPDEYTGYVARIESGETTVDSPTVLFTRDFLDTGSRYDLLSAVEVFSERLRLLRSVARMHDQQEENGRVRPP